MSDTQVQNMQRYYRWHAAVYDATRWAFLFGRKALHAQLPHHEYQSLVEAGCGTGWNLKNLARQHPGWQFQGFDVSSEMLTQSAKATADFAERVQLIHQPYGATALPEPADIVLFSYALTMFNPGWEAAIEQAWNDLKPGGLIAVVDFHDTRFTWFRRWMKHNHVRMEGQLLPFLEQKFQPVSKQVHSAPGLWRYFIFLGKK